MGTKAKTTHEELTEKIAVLDAAINELGRFVLTTNGEPDESIGREDLAYLGGQIAAIITTTKALVRAAEHVQTPDSERKVNSVRN